MGEGRVRTMGTKAKLIQPIATRCVRAARSGRIEHDPRRTRRVVAQTARHKRSDKSKAKRGVKHGEWSDCRIVPKKGGESRSTARRRQPGVGLGKATDKGRKKEPEGQKSKVKQEESSMRERPNPAWPRRLADWINPEGAGKVHSLVDKVYSKRNLAMAWERVRGNAGSGGIDGQSIGDFAAVAEEELERLHQELKAGKYEPRAVRPRLDSRGRCGL